MGIRLKMLVIQEGTTAWHFMGTMDQNVLKIMMLYRNIFPLIGNGKYICKDNNFLCKNCPKCKRLTKIRYIRNTHYQKKREICTMFSE